MRRVPAMLCLVTDRHRLAARRGLPPDSEDLRALLVALAGAAARAGVSLVQVRERDLGGAALTTLVRQVVAAVADTGSRVVVNDRADVAWAAGAHGVHLRHDSVPVGAIRGRVPADWLIGQSVHDAEGVTRAVREGADYLIAGTVFESHSKPGAVLLGIEGLQALVQAAGTTPVLAIGGIVELRAAAAAAAGASGVAAIDLFLSVPPAEMHTLVRRVRDSFDTARSGSLP